MTHWHIWRLGLDSTNLVHVPAPLVSLLDEQLAELRANDPETQPQNTPSRIKERAFAVFIGVLIGALITTFLSAF